MSPALSPLPNRPHALAVAAAMVLLATLPACTSTSSPMAVPTTPGHVFRECADCPEMVVVPAGSARLGSTAADRARFQIPPAFANREAEPIDVTIRKPFAVSRFEITRAQYARYAAEAGVNPADQGGCYGFDVKTGTWPSNPALNWRDPGFPQGDEEPVICMNYPDAKAYVAWLAKKTGQPYRLLSETEWEYAARGGATTTWPWGDSIDAICTNANIYDKQTARLLGDTLGIDDSNCEVPAKKNFLEPVGSYAPNGFGLYDMVGNAWEMVEGCATDTYAGVPTDGRPVEQAGCTRRMPRGGGWNSRAWTARLAIRGQGDAAYRGVALGLRVARDLP